MKVCFSERAFAAVLAETTEKITTETGGLFLGAVENGTFYIVEAIDPGPKSVFEVAYFEYDQAYTQHLINKIANLYEEKLTLIGLWHRHPGSFDIFSGTDDGTNTKYAKMRSCGAISALVNIDPVFRLTMYHVAQPCRYSKISYEVGDHLIPEKYFKLKSKDRFEKIMQGLLHPEYHQEEYHKSVSLKGFMDMIEPYYADRILEGGVDKPTIDSGEVRDKLIDVVVSDISFMSDVLGIEMSVLPVQAYIGLVQETADGKVRVNILYNEKDDSFAFKYKDKIYVYESGLFENLFYMAKERISSGFHPDSDNNMDDAQNHDDAASSENSAQVVQPNDLNSTNSVFANFLRMFGL